MMGRSKNIKRSLIITVLTAAACVALFISSTFAWFTDSQVSGKALLTGGSLNATMAYRPAVAKNVEYAEVTDEISILKESSVWVPGHVEAYNLKISNVGTVDFQYQLQLAAQDVETVGTNLARQSLKLSEYVRYFILEGEQTFESGPEAVETAVKAAEAAGKNEAPLIGTDMTVEGVLDKTESRKITLVVWMPTDLGDEVNYRSEEGNPQLKLAVTLVANQLTGEADNNNGNDQGTEETLD